MLFKPNGRDGATDRRPYPYRDAARQSLLDAGFFREISPIGAGLAVVAGFDVVEFLAVYAAGDVYLAIAAYRGPIRAASAVAAPLRQRAEEPAAAV